MAVAHEVNVKFLQHLNTDGGSPELLPPFFYQNLRNGSLGSCVEIVAVEKNIGIEKALNGHGLDRG
jgi:hypothetical protein